MRLPSGDRPAWASGVAERAKDPHGYYHAVYETPAIIAYNFLQGRTQGQLLQIQSHVTRLMPLLRVFMNDQEREKQEV